MLPNGAAIIYRILEELSSSEERWLAALRHGPQAFGPVMRLHQSIVFVSLSDQRRAHCICEIAASSYGLIERPGFAMTWTPLGMASKMARTTIVARFVRT